MPAAIQWPRFYVGLRLGHDTLNLHTRGGRDMGIDVSEYSHSDASVGQFAGYGVTLDLAKDGFVPVGDAFLGHGSRQWCYGSNSPICHENL